MGLLYPLHVVRQISGKSDRSVIRLYRLDGDAFWGLGLYPLSASLQGRIASCSSCHHRHDGCRHWTSDGDLTCHHDHGQWSG